MVLYLCLVPNRGARIGHQTHDYFSILTFCIKMNYNYVFHDFIANSAEFNKLLKLNEMHQFNYNKISKQMKVIQIEEIIDNIFSKLNEINLMEENICVYGQICGHEDLIYQLNKYTNINDIRQTKLDHRVYFTINRSDLKIIQSDYVAIHLRCGDIINDQSRYLSVDYFINQYQQLIKKIPELINLRVYVVTEHNFSEDEYITEKIPSCIIIKQDACISLQYLMFSKYLIASRSGFSNLAYILGNCQVIKPPLDWNDYYDNLIKFD